MAANTWPQLTFVWDPTFGERPGAEFFRSRLRRAQRVPPEEASSDVRAFVESAALLEGICTDVPCTFGPEITCPHESTQLSAGAAPEAMAVALYRHALANYITDGQPEHYLPFTECLAITGLVYFRWGAAPLQVVAAVSARGRRRRRHRGVPAEARGVAAQVLHLWGAGCVLHADGTLEGRDRMAQHFAAASRLLDRPAAQRECGDQLAALAAAHGLPAFSLPQLRYLLHYFAARRGIEVLAKMHEQLVASQLEAGMPSRATATTAAVEARLRMPLWRRLARETQAEAMAAWQLAPDRPAALNCVHGASLQGIGLPDEMRAVISARTIELARTQRSDRWLCQACHDRFVTVVFSASAMLEPTERPLLQAKARQAEELHAEAAEALARSKRLLPQPWVTEERASGSSSMALPVMPRNPLLDNWTSTTMPVVLRARWLACRLRSRAWPWPSHCRWRTMWSRSGFCWRRSGALWMSRARRHGQSKTCSREQPAHRRVSGQDAVAVARMRWD